MNNSLVILQLVKTSFIFLKSQILREIESRVSRNAERSSENIKKTEKKECITQNRFIFVAKKNAKW